MSYNIMLREDANEFLADRDEKSKRICRDNLLKLEEDPFPGGGRGDKEKLENSDYYRMHISRQYTAMYEIDESDGVVKILDLLTIDQAHKKYGRYVR